MPPCAFRLLSGVPCPFCGMTTGFAQMAHGNFAAAWRANLMAPPAFALTIALALCALYGVIASRPWVPQLARTLSFPRVVLAVILLFWIANLAVHYGPQLR